MVSFLLKVTSTTKIIFAIKQGFPINIKWFQIAWSGGGYNMRLLFSEGRSAFGGGGIKIWLGGMSKFLAKEGGLPHPPSRENPVK